LMLNWWVSEMVAAREERTAVAGFELSARRASRFCTCRQLLQTCDEWLVVPWGPP
jgi:hypothetical protein